MTLMDCGALLLPHLEATGLAYTRCLARLRSAVASQDETALLAALAECQPLLEAWSDAGVMRRAGDDLWADAYAPLKQPRTPHRTYASHQPQPYVPGVAPALVTSGELRRVP